MCPTKTFKKKFYLILFLFSFSKTRNFTPFNILDNFFNVLWTVFNGYSLKSDSRQAISDEILLFVLLERKGPVKKTIY